jgi:hypothetical protein
MEGHEEVDMLPSSYSDVWSRESQNPLKHSQIGGGEYVDFWKDNLPTITSSKKREPSMFILGAKHTTETYSTWVDFHFCSIKVMFVKCSKLLPAMNVDHAPNFKEYSSSSINISFKRKKEDK